MPRTSSPTGRDVPAGSPRSSRGYSSLQRESVLGANLGGLDGGGLRQPTSWRATVLTVLCLIVGFRTEVFFAVSGALGFDYEGSTESSGYIAFIVIASALIYIAAARFVLVRRMITIPQLVIMALPLIFLVVYLLDDALGRTQASSERHFVLALALACPAAVAGMLCAGEERVRERLAYAVEPLMLVFTLSVALSAIGTLQGVSQDRGVGGATYQTASYLGGLAFNCNLYYIFFGRTGIRPWYTRTKAYSLLSIVLLPVQVIAVLLSGGRGGFVLVAVGGIIQLLLAYRSIGRKAAARLLLAVVALLPIGIWGIPWLVSNPVTGPIVNRVFAYVGTDEIDWSGTSGRDVVYGEALRAVENEPLFGYGLFSWGLDYYPHNMLLELLLNGGIFYVAAWALLLASLVFRVVRVLRSDPSAGVILPLSMYPLVMLQFSGTYMTSGPLWFVVAFVLCLEVEAKH